MVGNLDNLSDCDEMSKKETAKRKSELAYQVFFLVVKQAVEDLEEKLARYYAGEKE